MDRTYRHRRILGGLLIAWAALQALGALWVALDAEGRAAAPVMYALINGLVIGAFALAGWALWRTRTRGRVAAGVLSALLLFLFPLGTALGLYGLWVTLRFRPPPQPLRARPAPAAPARTVGPRGDEALEDEEARREESLHRPHPPGDLHS